jgi:hypothetical protein
MTDQPVRRRLPIVASREPRPTIGGLIERLDILEDERLGLIQTSKQLRERILWMVDEQKRRDARAWPKQSGAGESASNT